MIACPDPQFMSGAMSDCPDPQSMSGAILACSDPQLMAALSFRMADDAQKIEMMLTHLESEMWTVNMMGEQSLRAKLCALDELNDYSRKLQEELDAAEFEQKSRSKKWKSLLVRKLPETATEDDLWAAISVFGEVDSVCDHSASSSCIQVAYYNSTFFILA